MAFGSVLDYFLTVFTNKPAVKKLTVIFLDQLADQTAAVPMVLLSYSQHLCELKVLGTVAATSSLVHQQVVAGTSGTPVTSDNDPHGFLT